MTTNSSEWYERKMELQKKSVLSIWLFELKREWQKKNTRMGSKQNTKVQKRETEREGERKRSKNDERKYNETIKLEQQLN